MNSSKLSENWLPFVPKSTQLIALHDASSLRPVSAFLVEEVSGESCFF